MFLLKKVRFFLIKSKGKPFIFKIYISKLGLIIFDNYIKNVVNDNINEAIVFI